MLVVSVFPSLYHRAQQVASAQNTCDPAAQPKEVGHILHMQPVLSAPQRYHEFFFFFFLLIRDCGFCPHNAGSLRMVLAKKKRMGLALFVTPTPVSGTKRCSMTGRKKVQNKTINCAKQMTRSRYQCINSVPP